MEDEITPGEKAILEKLADIQVELRESRRLAEKERSLILLSGAQLHRDANP